MDVASKYQKRIDELNREIDRHQSVFKFEGISSGLKCMPKFMIVAIFLPLIYFLIFFFLKPPFVKVTIDGEKKRSLTKVFVWTLFVTFISWTGMYFYYSSKGYDVNSLVCVR
jgi:hypothetical protein